MADGSVSPKTYSGFRLPEVIRLARSAFGQSAAAETKAFLEIAREDERKLMTFLGHPVEGYKILEVGPGQSKNSAIFFAMKNRVITLDLNAVPNDLTDFGAIWAMLRTNGVGRAVKSIGRLLIRGLGERAELARQMGVQQVPMPTSLIGDICTVDFGGKRFDIIYSFSVFEHISQPEMALRNIVKHLKQGGVFFIQIHLYTSNSGHHDVRAFTGGIDDLPLWGHLRLSTQEQITPSSYLNEWRLNQWRDLMNRVAPGYQENLYQYEHATRFGSRLTPEIRAELGDYSNEELFTLKAEYLWQKH